MIAFKYTKTDGAEYLSHLDLLRHVNCTLRRAGIKVAYSQGFNKHARIFMSNPLGTGIKSVAEYCAVDTDFNGDFKKAFNDNSPKGIKCVDWYYTPTNPNFAYKTEQCLYRARGINTFNVNDILNKQSIILTDSRGREVDIRPRIYAIECKDDGVYFWVGCNEKNLRPELLANYLCSIYGGNPGEIIKLDAKILN